MAAAGALIGAIGGQTSSGLGTLYSGEQSRKAQKRSERFQREVLMNRIGWMVGDMKRAGINPILAAGINPGSQGGVPYSGVSQASGAGASAGARAGIEAASAKAAIALAKEKIFTEDAIQQKAHAEAQEATWRANKHASDMNVNEMRRVEALAHAGALDSSARKMDFETYLLGASAPSAETRKEFRESWIGKKSQYLRMIREDFGVSGHVGAGAYRSDTTTRRRK